MELLTAFAMREQVDGETCRKILECVTTQEAIPVLEDSGKLREVMQYMAERICFYLEKRAGGKLQTDCILYANEFGELARSKGAEEWFTLLAQEAAQ